MVDTTGKLARHLKSFVYFGNATRVFQVTTNIFAAPIITIVYAIVLFLEKNNFQIKS